MAGNQKPSSSSLPTVCEVEEVLLGLLCHSYFSNYDLKKAKLLSSWMCDPQKSPEEIYELIGPKFEKLQIGSDNKLTQSFLAAVVLDALGVISEREIIVLTGHWAKIARCIIKYLYNNNEGEANYGGFLFHPRELHRKESSWILSTCNTDLCPDHALRLELFGLIWAKNYLYELSTKQMEDFFVKTISELDSDVICNNHAHDLVFSAEDLSFCFDKLYDEVLSQNLALADTGLKITESLLNYEYNREVKFFQNLLKLTGILAKIARFQFQSKSRLLRWQLNVCISLFIHNFKKLFKGEMEKFTQICLHPFIYPYYIDLVYNITSSIMDLSRKLNKWIKNEKLTKRRQDKFRRLETRRNYMVYCMDSLSPPINLPPLLLKQELGMLKPTGRAELQRKVLNQPSLPLSFKYSKERVDFSEYSDELMYDICDMDEEQSDDDVLDTDTSEDYDGDHFSEYSNSSEYSDANDDESDDDNSFVTDNSEDNDSEEISDSDEDGDNYMVL